MFIKRELKNRLSLLVLPALLLLGPVFGSGVTAQKNSERPLETKAVAALVSELKEVVAKSGAAEKDAESVAQKWDQRRDLAGKTKSAVINLLYQDVKTVIHDSGVQYQIYSTFAFYKRIPDATPPAPTRSSPVTGSKPKAVVKLTDLTFAMHPYVGIEEELAKLSGTKDIKAEAERVRKERIEGFEEALKVNNELSAEQKAFVRSNYDQLIKMTDRITEDAINNNFPTEVWIMDGLDQSYSKHFTLKELNRLTVFFDAAAGARVLKYIRQTNLAELITGNGGKPDFTAADKTEHDRFVATRLGKKFVTAYLKDAVAYEQQKENAVRWKDPNADGFAIYQPENLNELFNRFVAENYKK
jgi:hypothetical protein